MSWASKNNDYYFSGGLAEFVPNPTPLTFSFFSFWFRGTESLGRAMKILDLPYETVSLPILEMHEDEAVVNLKHEEKTLYAHTLFSYKPQKTMHDTPQLSLKFSKLTDPKAWINTVKITKKQSEWIAFPKKYAIFAKQLLSKIVINPKSSIEEIDTTLAQSLWPAVIAIGTLCEFYYQFLEKEYKHKNNWEDIQRYISSEVAKDDWFFRSFTDQQKVKNKTMEFGEYINLYGIRSDYDYDLAKPRWKEIEKEIRKRIEESTEQAIPKVVELPQKLSYQSVIEAYIHLLIFRSEAKKIALQSIDMLRTIICERASTKDIAYLQRDAILHEDFSPKETVHLPQNTHTHVIASWAGKGTGVSVGETQGSTLHVTETNTTIPKETICIFPNASPQFSHLYPKCKGMIFLKGGQTSHGAIVAREYGIPAIIATDAEGIPNGKFCEISGKEGSWTIHNTS